MSRARVAALAAFLGSLSLCRVGHADSGAPWVGPASCKDPVVPVGSFCRRYGDDWSSEWPDFVVSLSARSLSYLPSRGGSVDGSGGTAQAPIAYSYPGSAMGKRPLRAYGGELGMFWYPVPYFYLGTAFAAGAGSYDGPSIQTGGARIDPAGTPNLTMLALGGVLGLRVPAGPISVRGDVLGGGQWVWLSQRAYPATGNEEAVRASAAAWLLEPRLSVDVWLTPFASLSAFVGVPNLDQSAVNFGLGVSGHVRAFDGAATLR